MSTEYTRKCRNCNKDQWFDSCIDRTRKCKDCNRVIEGINAYKTYEERIEYYDKILIDCAKENKWILMESCSIIAKFCADPTRFNIDDQVDYFHTKNNRYIKTKIIDIRYELFERVSIEITDAFYEFDFTLSFIKNEELWINAYDANIEKLNIFRPKEDKDCINVLCGHCQCILYSKLSAYQYVIGEPTQSHFSFELFTNIEPIKDNICKLNDNESMLNCKNNCHKPLWLIDHLSGYINLNGYQYGLACGRTYAFVEKYHDDNNNNNNNNNNKSDCEQEDEIIIDSL